jgi:hypothetical protein
MGLIGLAIAEMKIGEQLLLPYGPQVAKQAHTRAGRLGMKIATRTVMKSESEWTQLKRTA